MTKTSFYSFLQKIPKSEIHIHFEAVVSHASIKKLYKKRFGKPLSAHAQKSYFSYPDLNGFVQAFLKVQDLFLTPDDFSLVFDDLKAYLIKNNIVYCEAFFSPTAFIKKGFKYKDIVSVIDRNIRQIEQETGRTVRFLIDVSRTFGAQNAQDNYRAFREHQSPYIIGIGLGGAEQKGPPQWFEPVFKAAREDSVHVVAHAGEDLGPQSIWDTIQFLQVERIGHGITAIYDKKLMDYLKSTQLPLEICPTSNLFTKRFVTEMKKHPIRQLFNHGILTTINTDDPVFFKISLTDEYWNLYRSLHFSMEEIRTLIKNGFKATFLPDSQKESYMAAVDAAFAEAAAADAAAASSES